MRYDPAPEAKEQEDKKKSFFHNDFKPIIATFSKLHSKLLAVLQISTSDIPKLNPDVHLCFSLARSDDPNKIPLELWYYQLKAMINLILY